MKRALVTLTLLATTLLLATPAQATCNGPTCNRSGIVTDGCTTPEGELPILDQAPLYLLADCEYYCDPQMGPEYISTTQLSEEHYWLLREVGGALSRVAGAFVRDGSCGQTARLRFAGTLEPDTTYVIEVQDEFMGGLSLANFRTAAAGEFDDGVGCSMGARRGGAGSIWVLQLLGLLLALGRRPRLRRE